MEAIKHLFGVLKKPALWSLKSAALALKQWKLDLNLRSSGILSDQPDPPPPPPPPPPPSPQLHD